MIGITLTATLGDQALQSSLRRLNRLMANPAPLLKQIGMGLVAAADERFETQTDPWGRPWDGLIEPYAALKATMRPTSDHILTLSGGMGRFHAPGFHLMEQPIDGICPGGAIPVAAIARMASTNSRRTPAGGGLVRPSSRRPRYLSRRFAS